MECRKQGREPEAARQTQTSLYQELLECLEMERQALVQGQEEAILSLAARKSGILAELQRLAEAGAGEAASGEKQACLEDLRRRVARTHRRNHRLIAAFLEVVQDFLGQLQPAGSGTYRSTGTASGAVGAVLFERQA
jgi:flagellar biosynthesis/type III secretory pathway chaperone